MHGELNIEDCKLNNDSIHKPSRSSGMRIEKVLLEKILQGQAFAGKTWAAAKNFLYKSATRISVWLRPFPGVVQIPPALPAVADWRKNLSD